MTLTTGRQQFESWFTKKYRRSHWGTKKTASGEYQGGLTAQLWEVWQESRGCMANREAQPSITDEAIDRIVVPFSLDGLDEEKHHCEWHLYHDRERIRKELREYFTAPRSPEELEKYTQGVKDGLEWAARTVEANHPNTGDWLYDDRDDLAKAIRKGSDMLAAAPEGGNGE